MFNKSGWKIDVDYYYKNIDGFTSLTRGFTSTSPNSNFSEGNSTVTGLDVLIKKKFNSYSSWLGYTYSNNDFVFPGLNQGKPFRGNNNIKHSSTWSHLYKLNNFQFSLGWKYRIGLPYTQAIGVTAVNNNYIVNYDATNAKTLPDYHRLDFSFIYDFKLLKKQNSSNAKLGFSLLNVYGKKNLLNKSFSSTETLDDQGNIIGSLRELNKFSLGITPNLFFRINF